VFVDGNFAGALTAYRTSKPACAGDASVVIYSTSTGSHSISAQSNTSITWSGSTTATQGCNTIELIDQSSSGTGSSGGSGGGSSTGVGTVVSQCVSNVQRLGASQVNWVTMPSPFNGIDFKVYFLAGNGVYEVIWRNRYNDAIFFNFQPSVGTPATKTTYRDQLGSGHEESPPGVTVSGLNDGGTACMRVDQVRFGTDSGPYK
jgi:hypothetical protein